MWTRIFLHPGQTLNVGSVAGKGSRCYIAFKGGFPKLPEWLGSKSTTPSLGLGGLQGRALRTGDFLDLQDISSTAIPSKELQVPAKLTPLVDTQEIYVMHGPHDSDDFVTQSGRDTLYSAEWQVDHNCSRTGIRLVGPCIEWSRTDGGRGGGAHPSNVVDYPYPSPGGVNWTGDSPVIFPSDAPGFGAFLCPSTVVSADLWKLGQLRPGGSIRLSPISYSTARKLQQRKDEYLATVEAVLSGRDEPRLTSLPWQPLTLQLDDAAPAGAVLDMFHGSEDQLSLTFRQSGDCFIIGELGFQHGSFETSISANLLAKAIRNNSTDVFVTSTLANHPRAKNCGLTAGIAIMAEFDPKKHTQSAILSLIRGAYARSTRDLASPQPVPCRRLILPIAFDHPALQQAEDRYVKLQRSKAAYLADNVRYVQQNNGLDSRQGVLDVLRRSRSVIVAIGFMTGLPLLLPLNPVDRLTAQKHNPTRIYTPAGAVGVGGGLFCIYPAEQPGGYMIVARTIPVWDQFSLRNGFDVGKPWLCEPFDLVEFHEVSAEKYGWIEDEFKAGTYRVDIRESELDVGLEVSREREAFKTSEARRFLERQDKAAVEMQRIEEKLLAEWQAEQATSHPGGGTEDGDDDASSPEEKVVSPHDGKVWKILVAVGERVSVGQELLVLEAMKMEIKVKAATAHDGMVIDHLICNEGALVQAGRTLMRLSKMA